MLLEKHLCDTTLFNLGPVYDELLNHWKSNLNPNHPWGYFPSFEHQKEDYKKSCALATKLSALFPEATLAFIGMIPENSNYINKELHLDTDLIDFLQKSKI